MKLTTKRILACLLAVLMLALPLVACDSGDSPSETAGTSGTDTPGGEEPAVIPSVYVPTYHTIPEASDELIDELWAATQTKIDAILSATNELTPAEGGKIYYVSSSEGNDKADGLTPETAWKTLERVMIKSRKTIQAGDVVAFKRGDIFFTTYAPESAWVTVSGVTYTAYGEGPKPIITSAMGNAADPSYWKQMAENPNVWYTTKYVDYISIGNITFNDGEFQGEGVFLEYVEEKRDGKTINGMTGLPYSGPQDLHKERQFHYVYEDDMSSGILYLYSASGNPGEIYDTIYFGRNRAAIDSRNRENVTLDNLSMRYSSDGALLDNTKNITMQNCEIAYVGGTQQDGEHYNGSQYRRWDTRLGNGATVYGFCEGLYIRNNYVHHTFEEAFSTQHNEGKPMLDIHYTDNVIMYCRQAVTLWGATSVDTVEWSGNDVWYTGYEFPSLYKPWFGEDGGAIEFRLDDFGENVNFQMKNNVVAFASAMLSDFDVGYESYQFENNTYIGEDTCYVRIDGKPYHWDDSAYEAMKNVAHDETAEIYVVRTESDYQSDRTLASMSLPSDVKAGDVVTFGAYEQDNDASNGAEAIEWIVLEVKDGKALLLSKYILDEHYFYPSESNLYWSASSIREFFESDFMSRAFTEEEAAKLNVTHVHMVASEKYGEVVADSGDISRIFLLTAQELIGYLGEDNLKAPATAYAMNRTGFGNDLPEKDGAAAYWTLNFGKAHNKFVGYITVEGEWDQYGSYWWRTCNMGLRPAAWVTVG